MPKRKLAPASVPKKKYKKKTTLKKKTTAEKPSNVVPLVKKTKKSSPKPSTSKTKPAFPAAGATGLYLTNKELLAELKLCKSADIMSDRLARMLQLLCMKYGKKGNFANYTYNDDMQAYAMLMLVRTWRSFDPKKSNNPFAFFTQCIKNSFIQFLNQEKRQRNIRDGLLVDQGMTPSFGYADSMSEDAEIEVVPPTHVDDEEDHEVFERELKHLEHQVENLPPDEFVIEGEEVPPVEIPEEAEEEDTQSED